MVLGSNSGFTSDVEIVSLDTATTGSKKCAEKPASFHGGTGNVRLPAGFLKTGSDTSMYVFMYYVHSDAYSMYIIAITTVYLYL